MTKTCACGGKYHRTDIVGSYDKRYGRTMYRDLDPLVAHWECNKCGDKRTQKKRQPKPKKKVVEVKLLPRPLAFFYEYHGEGTEFYRWWNNTHPGDVFDIIDKAELVTRIKGAEMCGIKVVDHLPGFCDLGDDCPDHKGYH